MKVLQIGNSSDYGGAAIAMKRLHKGLIELGIDDKIFAQRVWEKSEIEISPKYYKFLLTRFCVLVEIIIQEILKMPEECTFPFRIIPDTNYVEVKNLNPDIINLHWIRGTLLGNKSLKKIKTPIVWTLHDEWILNGIENYALGNLDELTGFRKKCINLIDKKARKVKRDIFNNINNLTFVTPSEWLANKVKKNPLFEKNDVRVINNGIDLNVFKPNSDSNSIKSFTLPKDKINILFGAVDSTDSKRKGVDILIDSLNKVSNKSDKNKYHLVIFGSERSNDPRLLEHNPLFMGSISDPEILSELYASCDLFLLPSLLDNLPNTAVESLACGTPVIGFNVGGVGEIIDHLETGYLAEDLSTDDFANGISWAIENLSDGKNRLDINNKCRTIAEERYDVNMMAKKYSELYKSIINA